MKKRGLSISCNKVGWFESSFFFYQKFQISYFFFCFFSLATNHLTLLLSLDLLPIKLLEQTQM